MNHLLNLRTSALAAFLVFATCACSTAVAGDLVFSFTNPTFGGNPNNAAGLLAVANTINPYKAPDTAPTTALDKFTASLQSAMLSKLQSQVTSALFDGKGSLVSGTQYTAGDYQVTITVNSDRTVTLTTLEIPTGASTIINIGNIVTQPQ